MEQNKPRDITDEDIERLLNEATLSTNVRAAEQRFKGISKEQYHLFRARCKRDLYFLCNTILGNARLTLNLHGALCEDIRQTQNSFRFREYLLARGNFKSTIITIGHSIQIVLPYTEEDRQHDEDPIPLEYPYNLGTDCRLMIGHETHESAARFLYAITSHFTTNTMLMGLFPETVPHMRKNRVNKWELELPRTISGNPEPTIDTLGVGGKSQGRHYNYIKLDDIFGDKARDSEAEAQTTKEWFDNIQAFFSHFSKDKLDLIGTRYSFDDIYAHAEERYGVATRNAATPGKQLHVYRRKIEERNPKTGKLEITFPEEFTPESLEILKKNKKVYTAQYLNDPEDDTTGFNYDDFRLFYFTSHSTVALFDGPPNGNDIVKRTSVNVRDLDICFLCDPGVDKSGGFVVTGMDNHSRIVTLTAVRLEMKPPEFVEFLFNQVIRWQPRVVAIESDIFASVYQFWLAAEMPRRGVRFKIEPVYTKKREKDNRIAGLMNYADAHQIYINEKQEDLIREIKTWRKSKNIHILDAYAYGPEIWRPGYAPGTRNFGTETSGEQRDDRDLQTGYSAMGE